MTGRPPLIPEKKKRKTKTYMQRYQEFGSGRKFVKKKKSLGRNWIFGGKNKNKKDPNLWGLIMTDMT